VISAAGNQLLGESLYLGKPFFAIPEKHHHEQLINAHFLRASGAGDWTTLETFGAEDLRHFLSRLDEFDPALGNYQGKLIGNHDAVRAVTEALAAFGAAPTDEPKSAEIMNHA
jgi:UDP:flavonoid glycosyltransferase YjiC (YdhE family)